MALTPAEQAELAQLEAEEAQVSGLTPEEAAELAQLEAEETQAAAPKAPAGGAAQAALEGYGQTATLGYLPQLQAGVSQGIDGLSKLLGVGPAAEDQRLRAQGFQVPERTYLQDRDANIERHLQQAKEDATAAMAGKGLGMAATMLLPGAAATKLAQGAQMGRVGQGAAQVGKLLNTGMSSVAGTAANGATQAALYNPGDVEGVLDPTQIGARATNGLMGGVMSGAASVASKGLSKSADWAMQRAVGRKKYTPGVGNTLADEGIVGTKDMMKNQVQKKMNQRWGDMNEAAKAIPGTANADDIANAVRSEADHLIPSQGAPSALDAPKITKVTEMADDIRARGPESFPLALERRSIAGKRAFKNDDPLESLLGKASKREQAGYSTQLKEGYAAAHPGQVNKMAEADKAYGALARANRSLNEEQTLARSLMGLATKTGAGAGLGYLIGGAPGAAAGAAMGSPIGMSLAGQAAQKSSKLATPASIMALKAALEAKRQK